MKKSFRKNNGKIEAILLSGLVLIGLTTVLIANKGHTHQKDNPIVKTSFDAESNEYLLMYNEFWQKFNTQAAIMADFNHDSLVSQTEVSMFKNKFLERYKLILHPDGIFVLNNQGIIVPPETMMCYLRHYNSREENQKLGIDGC